MSNYLLGLMGFALVAAAAGIGIFSLKSLPRARWDKIPRARLAGIILATIDLLWCLPHSRAVLPPSWHGLLLPALLICVAAAYLFLDNLFARALGGFMILTAYTLLQASYTHHSIMAGWFAILCYIMGVAGIFICGKPHLMREWMRTWSVDSKWRAAAAFYCVLTAATVLIIAAAHIFAK